MESWLRDLASTPLDAPKHQTESQQAEACPIKQDVDNIIQRFHERHNLPAPDYTPRDSRPVISELDLKLAAKNPILTDTSYMSLPANYPEFALQLNNKDIHQQLLQTDQYRLMANILGNARYGIAGMALGLWWLTELHWVGITLTTVFTLYVISAVRQWLLFKFNCKYSHSIDLLRRSDMRTVNLDELVQPVPETDTADNYYPWQLHLYQHYHKKRTRTLFSGALLSLLYLFGFHHFQEGQALWNFFLFVSVLLVFNGWILLNTTPNDDRLRDKCQSKIIREYCLFMKKKEFSCTPTP